MSKTKTAKAAGAKKSASRTASAKKRVRRVIFKADEWYAGAAMSIGIAAGRSKSVRQSLVPRVDETVD